MKISVIIPVYNAVKYINNAVKSTLSHTCVDEVILVEDGSKDDSLLKCKELLKIDQRIRLYIHNNNENKGAGATRNLGVLKAKNKWIAFLDADDVFLPNRFDKELALINANTDFDGVYGALGVHYYSKEAERVFKSKFGQNHKLTTVSDIIQPEELKYVLLGMHSNIGGYFSLDTLTVKKQLLLDVGLFNPKLRLHQDTDMIVKLSCLGKIVSGEIHKPIALRGVHEENRITNNDKINYTRYLQYEELYKWLPDHCSDKKIQYAVYNQYKYFEYIVQKKSTNLFRILFFTL